MNSRPGLLLLLALLFSQGVTAERKASFGPAVGFEKNVGQFASRAVFVVRNSDSLIELKAAQMVITLGGEQQVSASFVEADANAGYLAEDANRWVNLYQSSKASDWYEKVPVYDELTVESLYPGVDVRYYSDQHAVEFDLVVSPGADVGQIALELDGVRNVERVAADTVRLHLDERFIDFHMPQIYQVRDGARQTIQGQFLLSGNRLSFDISRYDTTRTLIIDPVIEFGTYLGGEGLEAGHSVSVLSNGDVVVSGTTTSMTLPTGTGTSSLTGNIDAFIAKYSATGELLFTTYFGGSENEGRSFIKDTERESATALVVGDNDLIYIAGSTSSAEDFPLLNAAQPSYGGGFSDGFVAAFDTDGTLLLSTYIGGKKEDDLSALAINSTGIWSAGRTRSNDIYISDDAFQDKLGSGVGDIYINGLSEQGLFQYGTFLGGNADEHALGIATGSDALYLAGVTESKKDFPGIGKVKGSVGNDSAGFVTKLVPGEAELDYVLLIDGDADDTATDIALLPTGQAAISGVTDSGDFPGSLLQSYGGEQDGFLAVIDASGEIDAFSYLGGPGDDSLHAISATPDALWVAGSAQAGMPTVEAIDNQANGQDAYVAEVSFALDAVRFSSYFGGDGPDLASDIISDGTVTVLTGQTDSATGFPLLHASQDVYAGQGDGFVIRLGPDNAPPTITSTPIVTATEGELYEYQVVADDPDGDTLSYTLLDFPVGMTIDTGGLISFVPSVAGSVTVTIEVSDGAGGTDTQSYTLEVEPGDTDPPVLTIDTPTNGELTNVGTTTVLGSVNEPSTINVNGVDLAGTITTFNQQLNLQEGDNSITVTATDAAGNVASSTIIVPLDSIAPEIAVDAPDDGLITNDNTVTVSGSLTEDATLTLNGLPVTVNTDLTFSIDASLIEGDNLLTLTATGPGCVKSH